MVIGYEESSGLDVEPAKYIVLVTTREKRVCRSCEELGLLTEPLRARTLRSAWPVSVIVIDTVVSKYGNGKRRHRQSVILEGTSGLEISRATLDGWVLQIRRVADPAGRGDRRN